MIWQLGLGLIVATLVNISFPQRIYASDYPFIQSEESWCKPNDIIHSHEVDSKLLPPTLDQDTTSTCYAHSAYYLLSHLLKER